MILKIGESVIVKQGIKEPDSEEFEIGGWQGRVIEIDKESNKDNILITIEWDSLTLGQLPSKYIQESEMDGLDWKSIVLYGSDVDIAIPRDKKGDVKNMQDKLSEKYYWASLGEEGNRISKILDGVNPKNEMKCLQKWDSHLDSKLTFPFQAIVTNSEDNWIIKEDDKLLVKSLTHFVDTYGIIAKINRDGEKFEFPICDLEVLNKDTENYQLIEDYKTWFANK